MPATTITQAMLPLFKEIDPAKIKPELVAILNKNRKILADLLALKTPYTWNNLMEPLEDLGWEVWLNGMEVTQFTYFQQVGGLECKPVTGEITYGLERLAMALQGIDNIYDLVWAKGPQGTVTYGDVYHQTEVEMSKYNFEVADVKTLFEHFHFYENESLRLIEAGLSLPAYEMVFKASHTFNLLDSRHALSVNERQHHILKIRRLSKAVAESYYQSREALGFPLLKNINREEN